MPQPSENRLGLSLSGGGFRATLFHLGVIRFLRDAKLLTQVKRIGAVSGGSIMAAHLVLNWERYNGSDAEFIAAANEILAFVRSDVRGRVIRRWIFAWATLLRLCFAIAPWIPFLPAAWRQPYWTFTKLLERSYEKLYRGKRLQDLRTNGSKPVLERPQVFFYATSLTTGTVCSFGRSGFMWDESGVEKNIKAPETRVAFAVAASSAFPPLFPPIVVDHDVLFTSREEFPNPFLLTDGGVYDNLGIDRLLWYHENHSKDIDTFIVSDAGGAFDWQLDRKYTFTISRNVRASDLLMKRVTHLEYERLGPDHNSLFARVKIDRETNAADGQNLSPAAQRQLRNVRTDLDAFSRTEIAYLVRHGYEVAREVLVERGVSPTPAPPFVWPGLITRWSDSDPGRLRQGRNRKWRLVSLTDPVSWVTVAILVAIVGTPLILTLRRIASADQQARAATDQLEQVSDQLDALRSGGPALRTSPMATPESPIDFGTSSVGETRERTFIVENVGADVLAVEARIQPLSGIASGNSGDFEIVGSDSVNAQFDRPQQIIVRYTGRRPGVKRAELSFHTTDGRFSQNTALSARTIGELIDRGGENQTRTTLNGVASHACPERYAMAGAVFGQNDFLCRYVGPLTDSSYETAPRNGVSLACLDGYFMTALNVDARLIRCGRVSNPAKTTSTIRGQRSGEMTRCGEDGATEAGVMLGYGDESTSLLCGTVAR
jgi:predicted acylesterase/phospholipase RssA